MTSVVVEASTEGITAFNVPANKIGKIKFLEVDNQSASAITITIQDVFTPTPSMSNPNPSEVTKMRKVVTVGAGNSYSEKLDGTIEIFGECRVVGNASDANCKITIGYDFE